MPIMSNAGSSESGEQQRPQTYIEEVALNDGSEPLFIDTTHPLVSEGEMAAIGGDGWIMACSVELPQGNKLGVFQTAPDKTPPKLAFADPSLDPEGMRAHAAPNAQRVIDRYFKSVPENTVAVLFAPTLQAIAALHQTPGYQGPDTYAQRRNLPIAYIQASRHELPIPFGTVPPEQAGSPAEPLAPYFRLLPPPERAEHIPEQALQQQDYFSVTIHKSVIAGVALLHITSHVDGLKVERRVEGTPPASLAEQ